MKPPFPYFGGKQRIADQIVRLFPEHSSYVEPYAGGLSILLAKPPVKMETVNDLDSDIITFWRVLRDRQDEFTRLCMLTPHSREESLLARNRDNLDDLERARRVWVALTQRRGGQLMPTGWRYNIDPAGTSMSLPRYLNGYLNRFAGAIERLRNVSLENRPALEVIDAYGQFDDTLLYVDPPYPASVRGGRHATNSYRHEMKHDEQHRTLAETLHAATATVVLSGYPSPLYDELYPDWYQVTIAATTGQGNSGGSSGARTEVLWSNRELTDHNDALFHDWEIDEQKQEHHHA